MSNHHSPSWTLGGISPITHQAFFQPNPEDRSGIVELIGWWIDVNEHDVLCVFHHTPPGTTPGLWYCLRTTDDRLRFYPREARRRQGLDTPLKRRNVLAKVFGRDE